tara:strand:+ start:1126 stop:1353 length:228 start_codon:yes stop_codon:yes gene_type:complete
MSENKTFKTSDLALAAYMITKGLPLVKAKRLDSGKYFFEIGDPEDRADEYKLEFINSEYYRFDSNLKMLKKMMYT